MAKPFTFKLLSKFDTKDIVETASLDSKIKPNHAEPSLPNKLNDINIKMRKEVLGEQERAQNVLHTYQNLAEEGISLISKGAITKTFTQNQPLLIAFNIDKEEAEIDNFDREFKARARDYNDFRGEHFRKFGAIRYDNKFWSMGVGGLIAILFLLEASLNAFLFKESAGLATAYALSISQAFVNIGGCFLIGKYCIGPIFALKNLKRRIFYIVSFLIHLLFTLYLNLTLGIWRAINVMNPEKVEDNAEFANGALQPWYFLNELDPASAVVVFVGMILAVLAYLKGCLSDDPYPGYGKLAREALKAQNRVKSAVDKLNNFNISIKMEFNDAKILVADKNNIGLSMWSQAINDMEKIEVDYPNYIQNANRDYLSYVNAYQNGHGNYPHEIEELLFSDEKGNSKIVFRDAAQFFMTDEKRMAELKIKTKKYEGDKQAVEDKITVGIDRCSERVSKVFQNYPSQTNFP